MVAKPLGMIPELAGAAMRHNRAAFGQDEAELLRLAGDPLALAEFLNRKTSPGVASASLPPVSLRRAASTSVQAAPDLAARFLAPQADTTSLRPERLHPVNPEDDIDTDDPLAGESWPICTAIGVSAILLLILAAWSGTGIR